MSLHRLVAASPNCNTTKNLVMWNFVIRFGGGVVLVCSLLVSGYEESVSAIRLLSTLGGCVLVVHWGERWTAGNICLDRLYEVIWKMWTRSMIQKGHLVSLCPPSRLFAL